MKKKDNVNSFQDTGGSTDNSFQKTEGNTYNNQQRTGGEMYIGLCKLRKYPGTTELLKHIRDKWDLTLPEAFRWIAEHPEEAKKILKKDKEAKNG